MSSLYEVKLEAFAENGPIVPVSSDAHKVCIAFYRSNFCDLRFDCTAMYRADPAGVATLCYRIESRLNNAHAEAGRKVRDAICSAIGAVRITERDL